MFYFYGRQIPGMSSDTRCQYISSNKHKWIDLEI